MALEKLHIYAAKHPIGRVKPFDLIFNYKPAGVSGGLESPNGYRFKLKPGKKYVVGGAAVRRIIDFSNPNEFLTIIPGGQSGNIFDKHYSDQYDMYINGEYRRVKFYSSENPSSTLQLVP